jgi:hypothetical protein
VKKMLTSTMLKENASVMMDSKRTLVKIAFLLVLMVTVKKTSTKTVMVSVSVTQNTSGTIILHQENYIVKLLNHLVNVKKIGMIMKEDVNVIKTGKSLT